MATSTLTSKGQVTIPKEIRQRLGLQVGERLEFRIQPDGRILVETAGQGKLGRVPGLLRHLAKRKPASIEEMDAAIAKRVRERHEALEGR